MMKRSGLGRGLGALIPGDESPSSTSVYEIPIDQISPNPRQPRSNYLPEELSELADSINVHGVLQPLLVTRDEWSDQGYVLIAGERRLMAARQAGLSHVPVIVREATDQQRLEVALIENIQRSDLNPIEEANAYQQLSQEFQLSHADIAHRVGKSREAVSNKLRLIKLPEQIQKALLENEITEGHARALLGLDTPQAQIVALQVVLKKNLTVRQTEELVRQLNHPRPGRAPKPPEVIELEERLRTRLDTRVNIHYGRKGGTIAIHYFSDEELNKLIDLIMGE